MGSGKSTVGRQLAKVLGADFSDLDDIIENAENQTIAAIFSEKGEHYFRELESHCLKSIHESEHPKVIAVGGGTPCFFDNIDWMNDNGITVFLNPSVDVLFNRLKSETAKRPVLEGKSDTALCKLITEKLNSRLDYYKKAKIVIDVQSNEVDVLAEVIRTLNTEMNAE